MRCSLDVRLVTLGGAATGLIGLVAAGPDFFSTAALDVYSNGFSKLEQTYSNDQSPREAPGLTITSGDSWVPYKIELRRSPTTTFIISNGVDEARIGLVNWPSSGTVSILLGALDVHEDGSKKATVAFDTIRCDAL